MSWFSTGYGEDLDAIADEKPWNESSSSGPRRVWMPPDKTQRHIFLDDDPTRYWEHGFKWNGTWKGNHEPCVTKNKLGDQCPICDSGDKMWPAYLGLHTTINMTAWFTKQGNREVNFQREIFAAKLGSKKNPGILKKLERLRTQHGRLRGLVFDVYRQGSNSAGCGDEFSLVEKIEPDKIADYAREKLAEYVARLNDGIPEDKQVSVDKLLERNPWEPYNFEDIIKPRDIVELKGMFKSGSQKGGFDDDSSGGGGSSSGGGGGGGGGGGDPKKDFDDSDDIPY